jgi:hypothetical protein
MLRFLLDQTEMNSLIVGLSFTIVKYEKLIIEKKSIQQTTVHFFQLVSLRPCDALLIVSGSSDYISTTPRTKYNQYSLACPLFTVLGPRALTSGRVFLFVIRLANRTVCHASENLTSWWLLYPLAPSPSMLDTPSPRFNLLKPGRIATCGLARGCRMWIKGTYMFRSPLALRTSRHTVLLSFFRLIAG